MEAQTTTKPEILSDQDLVSQILQHIELAEQNVETNSLIDIDTLVKQINSPYSLHVEFEHDGEMIKYHYGRTADNQAKMWQYRNPSTVDATYTFTYNMASGDLFTIVKEINGSILFGWGNAVTKTRFMKRESGGLGIVTNQKRKFTSSFADDIYE